MGGTSSKQIDLQSIHLYCVGYADDIQFSSQDQQTQKLLGQLRKYPANKNFIYRIQTTELLKIFKQHAKGMMAIWIGKQIQQTTKSQKIAVIGFIRLNKKLNFTVNQIISFWRGKSNIKAQQSLVLMSKSKLLTNNDKIQWHKTWEQTQKNLIKMYGLKSLG